MRVNPRNAVCYMLLLEIHEAHWHSKDTEETWLTLYNLAFPKLVFHGAIVLGFFFFFFPIFNIL